MVTNTYLALGDSYSIGEQVLLTDSFPYKTVQLLRRADMHLNFPNYFFAAPEIIAKTGWTTDELTVAIGETVFLPRYDIVSLLIGVNNQYRERPLEEFKSQFEILLQMAIQFAGGIHDHVYVLSIPDWGITPFAKDRDSVMISSEIDKFNLVCKQAADTMHCHYIDITELQRIHGADSAYLAADGLHPSGMEYGKWAEQLSDCILKRFSKK